MSEHTDRLVEFLMGLIIFKPVKLRRCFLKRMSKAPNNWHSVDTLYSLCKADLDDYIVEDILNSGFAVDREHGSVHQIKITANGMHYIKMPEAFLEELTVARLVLKALHLYSLLHWD